MSAACSCLPEETGKSPEMFCSVREVRVNTRFISAVVVYKADDDIFFRIRRLLCTDMCIV